MEAKRGERGRELAYSLIAIERVDFKGSALFESERGAL